MVEKLKPLDWTEFFSSPTLNDLRKLKGLRLEKVDEKGSEEFYVFDRQGIKLKNRSDLIKYLKSAFKTATVGLVVIGAASSAVVTLGSALGVAGVVGGKAAVPVMLMLDPASTVSGWELFIKKILWIVDFLMDAVIIFAGVSWMFGNRTKAIELLIGSGVGYVIVRHYKDIKDFFALL